jgi:hypothetical protein
MASFKRGFFVLKQISAANMKPRIVHQREHAIAAVLLAHHPADGTAFVAAHGAGGRAVNAELVLQRHTPQASGSLRRLNWPGVFSWFSLTPVHSPAITASLNRKRLAATRGTFCCPK